MRAPLTKLERETIIAFNEQDETASVITCNRALQNRLRTYAAKSPDCCRVDGNDEFEEYTCPKQWIKVMFPRQYTEEQRAAMSERFKKTTENING